MMALKMRNINGHEILIDIVHFRFDQAAIWPLK